MVANDQLNGAICRPPRSGKARMGHALPRSDDARSRTRKNLFGSLVKLCCPSHSRLSVSRASSYSRPRASCQRLIRKICQGGWRSRRCAHGRSDACHATPQAFLARPSHSHCGTGLHHNVGFRARLRQWGDCLRYSMRFRSRKEAYLKALPHKPQTSLLVSLADKIVSHMCSGSAASFTSTPWGFRLLR